MAQFAVENRESAVELRTPPFDQPRMQCFGIGAHGDLAHERFFAPDREEHSALKLRFLCTVARFEIENDAVVPPG